MRLILASQSASRKAMLTAAGVRFDAVSADVDEGEIKSYLQEELSQDASAISIALAGAKASAVSEQFPDALVLGGDSIIEVEGRLFDKPGSRDEAAEHLRFFSDKTMNLHSAAVLMRGGKNIGAHSDCAHLDVRPLSETFIADYLDHEWPAISGCVGCFRVEARGVQLFRAISGNHFTILGMPLLGVLDLLRTQGVLPK